MKLKIIDNILQQKEIELPYIFQKYLINDLIDLSELQNEEDINTLLEILIDLFIELSRGSTCLLVNKDSLFLKKYYDQVYNKIIGEGKPLIIRKLKNYYLLYTYKDYLEELTIEKILKERLTKNKESLNNIITEDYILKALSYKTIFITGGAGTGKTSLAAKIYLTFYENFYKNFKREPKVKIIAPTGKAAKVLESKILQFTNHNIEGYTIHKLLGYSPTSDSFRYNKEFPLEADLVIIDEASMIDLTLFYNLLSSISYDTNLIIIGDKDQLPSVDKGNVFGDIIENESLSNNVIKLKTQYRSNRIISEFANTVISNDKSFDLNITSINKNELLSILKKEEENAYFIELIDSMEIFKIIEIIIEYYKDKITETKILSISNQGIIGVENINNKIYKNYYHIIKNIPIIITENDYENNVFNGDIGEIIKVNGEEIIKFLDGKEININLIKKWNYAFAITVHKSQGSDYNDIFLILPDKANSYLLTRELLYTAITRAKKRIFIIGKKEIFLKGKDKKFNRYSGLKYMDF